MVIDRPPQKQSHAIHQSDDGDDGESPRGSQGHVVAKVQKRLGYRAEDDGEFELDGTLVTLANSRR